MKRLYYGGSFNPIHHGHLLIARAAAEAGGFDRVVLVPSAQPPHKAEAADVAPAADRAAMCRRAVETSDQFEVSELELDRAGPSYTIDTVRSLTRHGQENVHWLIGADTLPLLPTWHEPEALLREVDFIVVARPGWPIDWDRLPLTYGHLRNNVVVAPQIDISATNIRTRVAAGCSIDYLTPPVVVGYIHDRGLYRSRTTQRETGGQGL